MTTRVSPSFRFSLMWLPFLPTTVNPASARAFTTSLPDRVGRVSYFTSIRVTMGLKSVDSISASSSSR